MAERGVRAAGEDRRHRRGEWRRWVVAHSVNPAVKEVETTDAAAIRDRAGTKSELHELRTGDHAMLPSCQFGQQDVGCAELSLAMRLNSAHPV